MIENSSLGSIMGAPALGPDGEKIGTVGQVFVHPQTGTPTWATVHTGLFGRHETFVPLGEATFDRESLHLPFSKDAIKDAPRLDTDEPLTPDGEAELYRHYGITPDLPADAMSSRVDSGSHDAGVVDDLGETGQPDAATGVDDRHDERHHGTAVPAAEHESLVDHSPAAAYDRHPDPEAAAAGAEYAREARIEEGRASGVEPDASTIPENSVTPQSPQSPDETPPRQDGPKHRA